jgi:TRAP-type C4-dicarboxylate transport system permease small subunit
VSRKFRRWLDRSDRVARAAENALLVVLLTGLSLLACSQIFLRNALSMSLPWGDELVRLLVLWLAMLGAIAASRDDRQIHIDLLSRLLPSAWLSLSKAAAAAFTAVVCTLLTWQSWRFVQDSREFGDRMLGEWPAWVLQLILPIGFALIAYRYAVRMIKTLGRP